MKILLLVAAPAEIESVRAAVLAAGHEVVAELSSFTGLLRSTEAANPDLILIRTDFLDDSTLNHLAELNVGKLRPIVMFTLDEEHIHEAVRAGVSAYVVNGFSAERVKPILDVAVARFNEEMAVWRELTHMQDRLSERKLIERAKGILMDGSGMSEESAYQALRKEAMNKNMRLAEVASQVIAVGKLLTPKGRGNVISLQRR
ncbi:MAG: ANTAR domain-containing response regulator [Burkholderiales bacterium]